MLTNAAHGTSLYSHACLQVNGFLWIFSLFLICGLAYPKLTSSQGKLKWFQALYYLSSFWGQFGPNATTFVLASECYPTEMRGVAHGISAAVGKVSHSHVLSGHALVAEGGMGMSAGSCLHS